MGQKSVPVLFTEKEGCVGCEACAQVCPMDAIDMREDVEGFLYPAIDEEICIRCKACIEVCPVGSKASL